MPGMQPKTKIPYTCAFDFKPGFFLTAYLYRLFRHMKFGQDVSEELRRLHRDGTLVYAVKYGSRLDFLLYHYRFRSARIPHPAIAFGLNFSPLLPLSHLFKVAKSRVSHYFRGQGLPGPYESGYFKEALTAGVPFLLPLVDPRSFRREFVHEEKDSILFLLETQKESDRPIYLVPQLVLYRRAPERDPSALSNILFGAKDNAGLIRKTALLLRYRREAFIDFGAPLDLKAYLANQPPDRPLEEMAFEIRHRLVEAIDAQKRVVLGPILKSRQQLKEIVLKDPEITRTIDRLSKGDPKKRKQTRKKAGDYFDEIAADYNIAYVQLFHRSLGWLWNRIFEGIDVVGTELSALRNWARHGTMIYVPSHKSHVDYLVLNDILYRNNLYLPRIAAGKNLAFWPMGHIFRKSGAFFIRRSFQGARLYSKVFSRYIKALIEEGYPIEFFLEGGRSRSGKLVLPKTGFLNLLVQAFREGACDDLIFVPAAITYDRILEEKSMLKEVEGGEKESENLKQILEARRFLKRKYGKVYIRFGTPVPLREYLASYEGGHGQAVDNLAYLLVKEINGATLVTPLALVASAILSKHRRGFSQSELTATAKVIKEFLKTQGAPMASTLQDTNQAVADTLNLLQSWKVVDFLEDIGGSERFYFVEDEKKKELEYYKNSIIHFSISHAFVAISLLARGQEPVAAPTLETDYRFLQNLLRYEFLFDTETDVSLTVRRCLNFFVDSACIAPEPSGAMKLTMVGFDQLPIWAALVKTFLEAYWIATRAFLKREGKARKRAELLKTMNYQGRQFHKLGLIDHVEAVSQITFQNAFQLIHEQIPGLKTKDEKARASALKELGDLSQRLYDLLKYPQWVGA